MANILAPCTHAAILFFNNAVGFDEADYVISRLDDRSH